MLDAVPTEKIEKLPKWAQQVIISKHAAIVRLERENVLLRNSLRLALTDNALDRAWARMSAAKLLK